MHAKSSPTSCRFANNGRGHATLTHLCPVLDAVVNMQKLDDAMLSDWVKSSSTREVVHGFGRPMRKTADSGRTQCHARQ